MLGNFDSTAPSVPSLSWLTASLVRIAQSIGKEESVASESPLRYPMEH